MDTAQIASLLLAAWLLLGEPLFGRWSHRRLLTAIDRGQPGARLHFYRSWTWQAWLLAAITALVVWANGWAPAQLGLRLPQMGGELDSGLIGGFVGALIAGLVIGIGLARRKRTAPKPAAAPRIAGGDNVLNMLPRTGAERWGFAALAVTAGLTEEWIWRGFGVAVLQAAWPQAALAPTATVLVVALAFGWAHFYQGLGGMVATAALGALFTWLYLATGSLLLPMLLHVLIDLRALLVPVGTGTAARAANATDAQASIKDRGNP